MSLMWRRLVAWTLAASSLFLILIEVTDRYDSTQPRMTLVVDVILTSVIVLSSLLGALIITRQPQNTVGWILLISGFSPYWALAENYVAAIPSAPPTVTPGLFLALQIANLSWVTLIFPVLHLLHVFPTGRVLSSRWRWVVVLEWAMIAFLVLSALTSERVGPSEGNWTVANPIGIGLSLFELPVVNGLWSFGLVVIVLSGAVSMVMRYRRSGFAQRQQIKLLLFVFVFFAVSFALSVVTNGQGDVGIGFLFPLGLLLIPITIAFAILRKGLFDLNLIIRRTVIYALLTGILTAIYLGSIFVSQNLFQLQERASWQVAASTLLVTGLFSPLRKRIQAAIDRRLFRRRFDAQQVVERFAGSAQNQSDLELLSADLVGVIHQTIQPSQARLWIRA